MSRKNFARLSLIVAVAALAGFSATKLALYLNCHFLVHSTGEEIYATWMTMIFPIYYGIVAGLSWGGRKA